MLDDQQQRALRSLQGMTTERINQVLMQLPGFQRRNYQRSAVVFSREQLPKTPRVRPVRAKATPHAFKPRSNK